MNARTLLLLLAGLTVVPALAQGRRIPGLQVPSDLALPRDLAEIVDKLERAAGFEEEDPRFAHALYLEVLPDLQEILETSPNKVIESDDAGGMESLYQGVATRILTIYRGLSPVALEAYAELFEAPTRAALRRADDEAALFELVRLHPLTTASVDAATLLGDRAFEKGAPGDALTFYNTAIRNAPHEAAVRDELLLRSAIAARLANDGLSARQRIEQLEARGRGDLVEQLGAVRSLGDEPAAAIAATPQAVMGGNNRHTWSSPLPARPGPVEHEVRVPTREEVERQRGGDLLLGVGRRPVLGPGPETPFYPVVHEGVAYLSSGTDAIGVDLESGRQVFMARAPRQIGWGDRDHPIYYAPTVVGSRLYAPMLSRIKRGEAYDTIPIRVELPQRKVYCFDLATGKFLYELGGARLKQPKEARMGSFPFAPIVVGDKLLTLCVLVEESVKLYVCAFEMQRGEMLWSTWIGSGTVETTMFGEFAREPFAHQLAELDGVVYALTGIGLVAAVDVRTGQILWESTYENIPIEKPEGYFPNYRSLGWHNAPPMVAGDKLIVAPVDSDYLYAYDRHSGELRWRMARRQMTDLVGIEGDRILLHGKTENAYCVSLESGRMLWSQPLGGRASGRGAIAAGELYVAVDSGLKRFSIGDGGRKLGESRLAFRDAGNLWFSDKYLLFSGNSLRVTRNQAFSGGVE